MAINGHSVEERKTARELWRLKSRQKQLYKKWHVMDVVINSLQKKLTEQHNNLF